MPLFCYQIPASQGCCHCIYKNPASHICIKACTYLDIEKKSLREYLCIHLNQSSGPFAGIFRNKCFVDGDIINNCCRKNIKKRKFLIRLGTAQQYAIQHCLVVAVAKATHNEVLPSCNGCTGDSFKTSLVVLSGDRRIVSALIICATVLVFCWKATAAFTDSLRQIVSWRLPLHFRRLWPLFQVLCSVHSAVRLQLPLLKLFCFISYSRNFQFIFFPN